MPYIQFEYHGEVPPLGIQLISISGREAISELFHYEVVLETIDRSTMHASDIVGQDISFNTKYFDAEANNSNAEPRFIHGYISSLKILNSDLINHTTQYLIEIVPQLWSLTKSSHFQVFEDSSSSDIINNILSVHGINADIPTSNTLREHCIQHLETDYDFILRLMNDEGFIYYFEHSANEHKLIIQDTNQYMDGGTIDILSNIHNWNPTFQFISSKWDCGDYAYSDSSDSISAEKSSSNTSLNNQKNKHVISAAHIAGEGNIDIAQRQAHIFSGRETARYEIIDASSDFYAICAGASFSINDTRGLPEGTADEYVTIEAMCTMGVDSPYQNRFKCIPSSLEYWPDSTHTKHVMNGPITARVVESGGDTLGRVKVKFLYEGAQSEDMKSCWIRVAQSIGGSGFGAMFTPRIDEEVIVTFINGNPDRPLITGTLYNGSNKPHEDYIGETGKPTRNGFLTSFDGKKFNELYFEDKPGDELFYVRTDNNYERLVEANDTLTVVKGERKITIKEGDENQLLEKGDQTTTLKDGNQDTSLTKGNQTTTLKKGNQTTTLKDGNQTTTVKKGDIKTEASAENILMKSGNDTKIDAGVDTKIDAGSSIHLSAGSKIELKVGGSSMKMDAMGITLKVGGNSIKIEQSGITVKGLMVSIKGDISAEVKAAMTTVSGDGMLTVKGGIVMIN